MMNTVIDIQPRVGGVAGGLTPDELVKLRAKEILEQIPENLERNEGKKEMFKMTNQLLPSLTTVLCQEIEKFNRLMDTMRKSLIGIDQAIDGFIVMSDVLDKMYVSLTNGRVPANWEKVAYPSLKPLASWFDDLKERI